MPAPSWRRVAGSLLYAALAAGAAPAGAQAQGASDGAPDAAGRRGASPDPRADALSVVRGLLDAIGARDTAAARELLAPHARFLRLAVDADTAVRRWRTGRAFLRDLGGDGPPLRETIHDPEVTVAGPLATVRAPYRFFVDGELSHCGTDVFHLVRGAKGWVLATVVYTVVAEPSSCPPGSRPTPGPPATGGRRGDERSHETKTGDGG